MTKVQPLRGIMKINYNIMEKIKKFLVSKEAKRAYWTMLNTVMALIVSLVTYLASENVNWAIVVLPVAQAMMQFITKAVNK